MRLLMHPENDNEGLLVDRLVISDFRLCQQVSVEKFGRVNLITGKNGVGKTTLLEAIRVLATIGAPHVLWDIARTRDEQGASNRTPDDRRFEHQGITNLFRRASPNLRFSIQTGTRDLTAEFGWYREISDEDRGFRLERVEATYSGMEPLRPLIEIKTDTVSRRVWVGRRYLRQVGERLPGEYECMFVGSSGVSASDAGTLWDKIALTPLEDEVISSLAIIYPGLVRISMAATDDERARTARAKLNDFENPVPLRSLGDGVNRIFGIALALCNAKDGILLIDEVENGIHYSVQPKLWQFLVAAARRLNVQVFATTHSTDAIRAFQWATHESTGVDGVLTKLEVKSGAIQATQFDESDLNVAVTEAIEVR